MPVKYTIDEVEALVRSKGLTLLSTEYVNQYTKISVLCPKHGESKTSFKRIIIGTGCFKCGQEIKGSKMRLPIESVRQTIINKGYRPLFEEYKSSYLPLKMECSRHGIFHMSLDSIKANHGCTPCGYERAGKKNQFSLEQIKAIVAKTPFILISNDRNKHQKKVHLHCPKHGDFFIRPYNFSIGQGCQKCGYEKGSKINLKTPEQFAIDLKKYFPKLIIKSEYTGAAKPIMVDCPIHGVFKTLPNDLLGGHGCPKCGNLDSKPQREIFEFVQSMTTAIYNEDKIIGPKEIDIFVPSMRIGIEYNGLSWHSSRRKVENDSNHNDYRHINRKRLLCQAKEIRLITIFEDEWLEHKDQVKNFLTSLFHQNQIKVNARESEVKEITKKEAKDFLNLEHIQGAGITKVAFGLFYKNVLMGVITGSSHHRQGNSNKFVLNRMAFKSGVNVRGGSSKLLKALKEFAVAHSYKKMISWSDNRWSEGNVYKAIGFTLLEEFGPDYSYVKQQKRYSKQGMTKKKLTTMGGIGSTEEEMARSLGFYRIYDCGKKSWTIDLKKVIDS